MSRSIACFSDLVLKGIPYAFCELVVFRPHIKDAVLRRVKNVVDLYLNSFLGLISKIIKNLAAKDGSSRRQLAIVKKLSGTE